MKKQFDTLRLILGDQLHIGHSWLKQKDDTVLYVLMECLSETNYVRHHIQKVVGFFLAMRHFAERLKKDRHQVLYLKLDDAENQQSIPANIKKLVEQYQIKKLEYQMPDEYRLDVALKDLAEALSIPAIMVDSEHFLSEREAVKRLFKGKKQYLMETFYRDMRKRYGILMEPEGESPLSGRWNYDAENRKKLPRNQELPPVLEFKRDVSDLVSLLKSKAIATIGQVDAQNFSWPITRAEQLKMLDHFLKEQLVNFGTYQDAMSERDAFLFHSRLSFGLNIKLITPLEVINAAEKYWQEHTEEVNIAQVEGFIRQILGWREYMRGIYWAKMPDFAKLNYFDHKAPLPDFYWTAETKMQCLHFAIKQSLEGAYAHHIQRLMVTGNFALLLGVHPDEVDAWYLGIYMDAIEWVEITNTRGMSQFADGGIVGTKPYVSSANYIQKMSDYCQNCYYDRKQKHGEKACPFNSLYWDFYDRHRNKLQDNPRVGMMYRVWDKMDADERVKILEQADAYKKAF